MKDFKSFYEQNGRDEKGGKGEGTLTNADLDNFYRTVAPLLDSFKRRKLQQVIAKLKAL